MNSEQKYYKLIEDNIEDRDAGKTLAIGLVESFNGEVVEDWDGEGNYLSEYIGTVFSIYPSRKYYTPWAHSNVTIEEAARDAAFIEGFEESLPDNMWLESGEGDPCDLYLCKAIED